MSLYNAIGPAGFGAYEVDWSPEGPLFSGFQPPQDAPTLLPGLVDVHIHGAFGIDFMSSDSAAISSWATKMQSIGYEAFLPTTITGPADAILAAIERMPEHPAIAGFHLEGPFISLKHPGAQPPELIASPPSIPSEWDAVLDHPKLRLVTLAPEVPGGLELVRRLQARGVRVNMGHTDATYAQATAAQEAGMSGATHTYNAMRGLHHREAGALGFALSCDALYTELIYDRVHVSREAAGILLRAKPHDRVIGISDGTMASGLPEGSKLNMWGHDVIVGPHDVRLAANGSLAGSTITLWDAFQRIAQDFGIEVAIRMCSLNPRVYIGLTTPPKVWLEVGPKMDLLSVKSLA